MKNNINICHISDLHFGIYENKSFYPEDKSFSLTNSLIEFVSDKFNENEKPHFLIISGDITSISNSSEYKQFLLFMESLIEEGCLAKCKYGKYSEKDRIIIVPGNHDTVRKLKEGKKFGSDKLKSFQKNITKEGFNTPFGNKNKYCFKIKKSREKTKRYTCPIPCAFYYYPEYNILFPALVSCYFSQMFDPKVLEIYVKYKQKGFDDKTIQEFKKDIEKIIYNDFGWFPQNYRRIIKRTFRNFKDEENISEEKYKNLIKLAVTHHHVYPLDPPYNNTKEARQTLEILHKNGVISILHGHLHDILEENYMPDEWKDICSFFSCGTISGYCHNSVNKFNMIKIQNYLNIKNLQIQIVCYEANTQGHFTKTRKMGLFSDTIDRYISSMKASI